MPRENTQAWTLSRMCRYLKAEFTLWVRVRLTEFIGYHTGINGRSMHDALAVQSRAILISFAQILPLPLLHPKTIAHDLLLDAIGTFSHTAVPFSRDPRHLADGRSYKTL